MVLPVSRVSFLYEFVYGGRDCGFLKDISALNIDSNHADAALLAALTGFVNDVFAGNPMNGKNVLNRGGGYALSLSGHYHIGPYTRPCHPNFTPKNIRESNPYGYTSGPVVHYSWRGKEKSELVIIGLSPVAHQPFPKINDKKNPLRSRLKQTYLEQDLIVAKGKL